MSLRNVALVVVLAALPSLFSPSCYAQTADRYGGVLAISCPRGPQPHFYTQKIGDRWWMCDPAGHGFFMNGVTLVGYNETATWSTGALETKYGSAYNPYVVSNAEDPSDVWGFNWAINQVDRLRAWGFNWLADGAVAIIQPVSTDVRWNTSDHTIPNQFKMPFDAGANTTRYLMLPAHIGCNTTYPMKDMINGRSAAYTAWPYDFGDYFDPHVPACASIYFNAALTPYVSSPHSDYLIYQVLDESDQTGFLDEDNQFATIDGAGVPDTPVSYGGHAAWVTLATDPIEASATVLGNAVSYTDEEVYSKVQLANDLLNHYLGAAAGTYSIDPAAGNYAGTTNMATALAALNTAWSAHYSTLSTSDSVHCGSNLASCLQGGTYTGWGTGTGLLDEDGTCPSKGANQCWMGSDINLSGETSTMQSDMSAYFTHYLDQYFSMMTGAIHTYAPGILTQMDVGGWGAPARKEVLQAMAQYVDLTMLTVGEYCPTCTDTQARVDFTAQYLGDKPWILWSSFFANPDSAMSAYAGVNVATTQAGRGKAYQTMMNGLVNTKTTATGTYPVIGSFWWDMYDGQHSNEGLCTRSDNAYNGHDAVIATGTDQWGYSTGGEAANYGDFLDSVTAANNSAISSMPP
jgi:hypothetical protein